MREQLIRCDKCNVLIGSEGYYVQKEIQGNQIQYQPLQELCPECYLELIRTRAKLGAQPGYWILCEN